MAEDLIVPSAGESISQVIISEWLVEKGGYVKQDEPVVILETDKINVEVPAPVDGQLTEILKQVGESAGIGDVIARMEAGEVPASAKSEKPKEKKSAQSPPEPAQSTPEPTPSAEPKVSPAARRVLAEEKIPASQVKGSGRGGVVLKEDVLKHRSGNGSVTAPGQEEVVPMSPLRKRIAERLVAAQQTSAILTTFNEVDMSAVMSLRKHYKDEFADRHGVKLGFMSFFVKATVEALKAFPAINAEIRGQDIVYKNFYDIGVAVGGAKGLVVPVVRGADRMSFAEIELAIRDLATRAKNMKLTLDELQGGTFTISNGGVYGSMLSTPILNPPQSGILGLHNIVDRPMAVDGQVVVRPVMYLALSYDHRIVDGREAVSFLVKIKDCIENPARMLLEV